MIDTSSPYHQQDEYNGSSHHHDTIIDDHGHHDGYANSSSAYTGIKPKKELPEIELWLCSKLNTDWSSDRIASQINEETLELFLSDANHQNYDNFYNLGVSNSPLIKLRFIMCCLSVKKKQMSTTLASHFCTLFKNIIENTHGEDDWVRMMAEILYLFPEHSCLRTDIQTSILNELGISAPVEQEDSPQRYFQQAIKHFRNLSLKDEDGDASMTDSRNSQQTPFATLKPSVFKYLNASSEGNEQLSKEFNEKKHYLEEMANSRSVYSSQSCSLASNKHFNLRPSACKNLIEPLAILDELESESAKKNVGVKSLSPLKKVPSRPQTYNTNTHTPTSANMLNKNKLTGIKKINSNLPSTPKTTLIKTPTHGTQLISTPISATSTPRSVFLDDSVALQRIKEQQLNEKKRTSTKLMTDEQKVQEKERKKIEKIEMKEKKEKEKLEKKKAKEEAKKKQVEERKVAAQQAQMTNGANVGPGRKRRKNNPANAQQGSTPGADNMMPQTQEANVNQPMHNNPANPHQQALFSTTLMNHTAPYLTPMFNNNAAGFSHFPQNQYSNMSGLLTNPFFANQQNPSQPTSQQPGLMAPQVMPGNHLGKGQEQTSFTQLLGINSAQQANTRPPSNNLLPSIGTSSFPAMMGFHQQQADNTQMNGMNNQMMMMGRPQTNPAQMRQQQYPPNYQQSFDNTPIQQQQQPTPQPQQSQGNDEDRRQRVEHYLNTNILKDCNRVTEETRTKIFQFLTGRVPEDGPLEDKVLIHEEYGQDEKRQIFFHMDHTNRKWKKIMQKQSNQPAIGME